MKKNDKIDFGCFLRLNREEMKTLEDRIEYSLNKLRPYMMSEGGDVKIDHYDKETGTLYVEMVGACKGCFLAATDISDSVEVLLTREIPEVVSVRLVGKDSNPGFRSLNQQLRHPHSIEEQKKNEK